MMENIFRNFVSLRTWHSCKTLEELTIIRDSPITNFVTDVIPSTPPLIERGSKIWYGGFTGITPSIFGLVGGDVGVVVGKDFYELSVMTFYTENGVRVWASSYDPDAFMDVAAYIAFCAENHKSLRLGASLAREESVAEFVASYFFESGPSESFEEHLLIPKKIPISKAPNASLRRSLRKSPLKDVEFWTDNSKTVRLSSSGTSITDCEVGTYVTLDSYFGCAPQIETGEAVWHGFYLGGSLGPYDAGMIRGADIREVRTATLYTNDGIRLWMESDESNDFMDVAAYLQHHYKRQLPVRIGGRVTATGHSIPEIKIEYVHLIGPQSDRDREISTKVAEEHELLYVHPVKPKLFIEHPAGLEALRFVSRILRKKSFDDRY